MSGYYTQPTYGASSPSGAEECSWVGLGGYLESPLLRVGSEMDGPSTYYAWYGYSNASNSYKYEVSGAVNPGDDIELSTFWVPNSNYPAAFVFWDWNTMTNFYITAQVTSAYYDGSSAEFIDGRPSSSVPLADYTSNNWTECEVWNESGTGQPGTDFTTIPYLEFVMSDASGNELSYPNLPSSSNSFTNNWYLSQ